MSDKNFIKLSGSVSQPFTKIWWMSFWLTLSAAAIIASVYFNWSNWGNLALVNDDVHREFVTPIRLMRGEVIYKDFNFVYGPLPPYLNSWIVRILFLKTFTSLRLVALVLFSLNLLFLWLICRDLKLSWIFGPVLFGIVCWTIPYTFNPTTFNNEYTVLFAVFGTWCAIRTLSSNWWPWLGLGIACAGALLSKPEGVFVTGLASIAAYAYKVRLHKKYFNMGILYWLIGAISLGLPFTIFLFSKGLSCAEISEGILQRRFQQNLKAGYIAQYNYFFGINHIIVIAAGCAFIALIFYLIKLYQTQRILIFWSVFLASLAIGVISVISGQLIRVINDYQNLGDFFGGILGYWWYRQLPNGYLKRGFFVFWLSSLGGWMRPFFHIGALVIPFRVGGGMLLAAIFWFLILPAIFQKTHLSLVENTKRISDIFTRIGCASVLAFGCTGVYSNWATQWRYPTEKFETPYGSFLANRNQESTQIGTQVINWFSQNLKSGKRIVALEALPIELVLGQLPCIPLSQLNYQIYAGDTERIISTLDGAGTVEYVLVPVRHGAHHFGIQDYKLADYLDTQWRQAARFNVPDSLTVLSQMSPGRKLDSGLTRGFIIYSRRDNRSPSPAGSK